MTRTFVIEETVIPQLPQLISHPPDNFQRSNCNDKLLGIRNTFRGRQHEKSHAHSNVCEQPNHPKSLGHRSARSKLEYKSVP